ncbi:hypothetical protein Syun_031166 [Stephania yunnanensis]|uniref:Uncharacterized protein n=1 Tax=Stephania yunnanensis TaxID=152371 RepID=A0AAP0HD13_9MAGN
MITERSSEFDGSEARASFGAFSESLSFFQLELQLVAPATRFVFFFVVRH